MFLNPDKSFSLEKIYLVLVTFSTLLPGFGAIDNNPVRWMTIGFLTIIFLFYKSFISQNKFRINFEKCTFIILSSIYLLYNCLNSDNVNESFITLYKLIIIVSVFFASYLAVRKISGAFLFICYIFINSPNTINITRMSVSPTQMPNTTNPKHIIRNRYWIFSIK